MLELIPAKLLKVSLDAIPTAGRPKVLRLFPTPSELRTLLEYRKGEHKAYKKIIILTTARSGSNFLRRRLDTHPDIIMSGEVFNGGYCDVQGMESRTAQLKVLRDRSPLSFVERCVFRGFDPAVEAVGFTLFYDHCERLGDGLLPLLASLVADPDVRIIHLTRENLFRSYVSLEIAKQTKRFIRLHDGHCETREVIKLDPTACLAYVREKEQLRARYAAQFAPMKLLNVKYESMTRDPGSCDDTVLSFLGVRRHPLQTVTRRQEHRALPEIVTNYSEVNALLERSGYHFAPTED